MSTRTALPSELPRSRMLEPIVLLALVLEDLLFSVLGPLLPAYQRSLGLGDGQVGLLSGSYELGVVLGSLGLVLLARRVAARPAATAALLGLGAATVLFGIVGSFPALLLTRTVAGVMAAVCWSAAVNRLLDSVPSTARGRTMGRVMSATHAGTIGGPSVGALAASVGHPAVFGLLGAVTALLGLLLGRAPDAAATGLPHERGVQAPPPVRAGRRHAGLDPVALACVLACNLASGALGTFVPLGLASHGFSAGAIGATATVGALSGVVWGPIAGHVSDQIGASRTAIIGFAAMAGFVIGAATVHSPFALAGLALACGWAAMFAIVPSYLSAGGRSGANTFVGLAASQGFTAAGGFVGALLAGTLGGAWGWHAGLGAIAAILVFTAVVVGLVRWQEPLAAGEHGAAAG